MNYKNKTQLPEKRKNLAVVKKKARSNQIQVIKLL